MLIVQMCDVTQIVKLGLSLYYSLSRLVEEFLKSGL